MKHLYLFFTLILLSAPAHSAPNHLLKHVKALSRDYFYIDFSQNTSNYQQQASVGGEHENHYYILGFKEDTFVITMQSPDGKVGHVPTNLEYKVLSVRWNEAKQLTVVTVNVIEQQTWIKVSFSAHPYADYSINIEKVDQKLESRKQ